MVKSGKVKFGICVYNWEPFSLNPKTYEDLALEAESLGFDSFFVTDHFLRPHAPKDLARRQHATLEAWTLLANLAGKTKKIKLGTCVSPIPLRKPQLLAKMVTTVDILSEGRVIFGAGAGWDRPEFETYGEWHSNRERVDMTREGLELIRRLWTEDEVDFEGRYYNARGAILEPKPLQRGGPPIWVGAIHNGMLKLTAELGDGWFPGRAIGATPEFYSKNVPLLQEYARKYRDKKKKPLIYSLMGYFVKPGASIALPALGPIDRAGEIVQEYRNLGCEYIAAMFFPASKFKEMMRSFAREVVPSF